MSIWMLISPFVFLIAVQFFRSLLGKPLPRIHIKKDKLDELLGEFRRKK